MVRGGGLVGVSQNVDNNNFGPFIYIFKDLILHHLKSEVYIPQLFCNRGVIKPERLGKNGEENWYIRTFFHIFTQKWANLIFLGKL